MGFIGTFLMLAFVGWLVFGVGRRVLRSTGRLIPFTLLGIASVAAGVALFGSDDDEGFRHVHVGPWDVSGSLDLDDSVAARKLQSFIEDREDFDFDFHDKHVQFPKWVLIALGSILIISGTVLASREKTRPVAFKALTVLAMAAGGFMVFSFFNSPPHQVASRDRVVRVAPELAREIKEKANEIRERVSRGSRATKPTNKPIHRAKRPSIRPDKKSESLDLTAELPPRAGEIPVEAELAKSASKTPEPPAAKVPAAAPAVEASATPAAPDPAQQAPAPEPPTTPEAKATTPETPAQPPAEPAATPSEAPVAAPESPPAAEVAPAASNEAPAAKPETPPAVAVPAASPPEATPQPATPPATTPPATTPPAAVTPAAAPPAAVKTESPKPAEPPVVQPIPEAVTVVRAAKRPNWVETSGRLEGAVYRTSVKSGLYVDVPECQRALDLAIRKQAAHYVDDYLGAGAASTIDLPLDYLRKHLVKEEFGEVIQSESVGPMQQIHALLEFDDEARADFHGRWRDALVTNRLWYTGSAAALILAMLGTFYSYLTLDLRTGGAHKGQLRLAATLVALIIMAGALLARQAVPF